MGPVEQWLIAGGQVTLVLAMPTTNELVTLSRYFVWADSMKNHFEEALNQNGPDFSGRGGIDVAMYMSLWYGCLYVVIEGWQILGVRDRRVDPLLASPNVGLLRRYRNAVFHYHKEYWPEKFQAVLNEGERTATWVRTIHNAFTDYFEEFFSESGSV